MMIILIVKNEGHDYFSIDLKQIQTERTHILNVVIVYVSSFLLFVSAFYCSCVLV